MAKKYIYSSGDGLFYWMIINAIAKVFIRRKHKKQSKASESCRINKKLLIAEYIATKVVSIKLLLHDGILIDGRLFRIEDPDFGEPGEPAVFRSPIGVIKHDARKVMSLIKGKRMEV